MKQIIILLSFGLINILSVTAQKDGIQFFEGSWQEVLAEAAKQDKLIFVDAYAVWCKPCKMMEKEVFVLSEVANFYNQHFINYKLDVDTKEGSAIADQYKVKGMPTYLFVDSKEKLSYQAEGYIPKDEIIQKGEIALVRYKKQRK